MITPSPLVYGLGAALLVVGTLAVSKSCEVSELREANAQLVLDVNEAVDANDSNMDTIATQGEALKLCRANRAADKAASERELAALRKDADNLAARLAGLDDEREAEYESDDVYRAWSDARAPDSVFDRLRRAQAVGGDANGNGDGGAGNVRHDRPGSNGERGGTGGP